jgi:hypothetical protein
MASEKFNKWLINFFKVRYALGELQKKKEKEKKERKKERKE